MVGVVERTIQKTPTEKQSNTKGIICFWNKTRVLIPFHLSIKEQENILFQLCITFYQKPLGGVTKKLF